VRRILSIYKIKLRGGDNLNRKIFVGVFFVAILMLTIVWEFTGGGVIVGPRVDETSEGSNTLYADETLYSYMLGAVDVVINGIMAAGEWDDAYYKNIWLTREDSLSTGRNAYVWIMNDAQYLYIAINFTQYAQDYGDWIWLYFDEDHHHSLTRASNPQGIHSDTRVRQLESEDRKGRLLYGPIKWPPPVWATDAFWNGTWVNEALSGGLIPLPTPPDPTPTGTVDFQSAWGYDSINQMQTVEWKIPLDSLDMFDINVKSGGILGLYIEIYDAGHFVNGYQWPKPSAVGIWNTSAYQWGDLWTTKTFSASIPHVHDDVTGWRAYLGVQNTGTKSSTVVFRFSDGYVAEKTLISGEHMGDFVKGLHGGTNFVGSILVYSDQPFTALLNQRKATEQLMGQTVYIGEN